MADKPWELVAADVPVDKFQGKRFDILQCPEKHFLLVDASLGSVAAGAGGTFQCSRCQRGYAAPPAEEA
jgi:hypothetical protein